MNEPASGSVSRRRRESPTELQRESSEAKPVLRVGTRGSALATTQAQTVADAVAGSTGARVELVRITTHGDVSRAALTSIGGTGVFVTAVREALLAGEVDVVVHSFKDLPTAPAEGIALAAVPVREEPADALCARDGLDLDSLPPGATVGTGSPRRVAQILAYRTDLTVVPIRGNVDSRLSQVRDGRLDAVVLAAAGLRRLGLQEAITALLPDEIMLPAPAQGALAVECRLADQQSSWFASALAELDDPAARAEATAERSLLSTLEAGCSAPVGARARARADELSLAGLVIAPDGRLQFRGELSGGIADAAQLGRQLAESLLADGAAQVLRGP